MSRRAKGFLWISISVAISVAIFVFLTKSGDSEMDVAFESMPPDLDLRPQPTSLLEKSKRGNLDSSRSRAVESMVQERGVAFHKDSKISYYLIDTLSLTEDQALAVQESYDSFRSSLREAVVSRTVVDEEQSNPSQGVSAFVVAAFPEQSKRAQDSLKASLEAIIGTERSEIVVQSIAVNEEYPFLGKYQIKFSFEEFEAGLMNLKTMGVTWSAIDELTGEIMRTGSDAIDTRPGLFSARMGLVGEIFSLTEDEAPLYDKHPRNID